MCIDYNCDFCIHFKLIWGQFCECDNFSCDRRNNTICSGHGNCNCGICECAPGWTGDACECSTDTSACIRHGVECSGHVSIYIRIYSIFYSPLELSNSHSVLNCNCPSGCLRMWQMQVQRRRWNALFWTILSNMPYMSKQMRGIETMRPLSSFQSWQSDGNRVQCHLYRSNNDRNG